MFKPIAFCALFMLWEAPSMIIIPCNIPPFPVFVQYHIYYVKIPMKIESEPSTTRPCPCFDWDLSNRVIPPNISLSSKKALTNASA